MHKRATTWVLSGSLAVLHLSLAIVSAVSPHNDCMGVGLLLALFDFPVLLLCSLVVHLFGWHVSDESGLYLFVVSVVGTLMWAAVGAYIGYFIDSIRDFVRHRLTTRSSEQRLAVRSVPSSEP